MTPQAAFRLRITGPGGTPETLDLPPGRTTLGREDDNTLALRNPMVSRYHAVIECTAAGKCFIIDQKSTNGTLVNGTKLEPNAPLTLMAGAVIVIGPFHLTMEQNAPPAVAVEPPPPPPDVVAEPQPPPALIQPALEAPPAPPVPPVPDAGRGRGDADGDSEGLLPGLRLHSQRLLQYLPDIYQPPYDENDDTAFSDTDHSPKRFISRFLALFESILLPIEWTVDNFDLFLGPSTAPAGFLPWLASWFEITCDGTWTEQQRRTLVREAHQIYAQRGTRQALSRMLEIYIGQPPKIVDDAKNQKPHTFDVLLPIRDDPARRPNVQAIIDAHKPAHTTYALRFKPERSL